MRRQKVVDMNFKDFKGLPSKISSRSKKNANGNILLIILMGFARWYKKCHNIVQIIAGIIYGGITTYLYYEYVGKYLIK